MHFERKALLRKKCEGPKRNVAFHKRHQRLLETGAEWTDKSTQKLARRMPRSVGSRWGHTVTEVGWPWLSSPVLVVGLHYLGDSSHFTMFCIWSLTVITFLYLYSDTFCSCGVVWNTVHLASSKLLPWFYPLIRLLLLENR